MTPGASHADDWDQHWDAYASAASRNPAQRMRRRLIQNLLRAGSGPARILDIGCGQGDLVALLEKLNPRAQLVGIDYSGAGIRVATAKVPAARFRRHDLITDPATPPELAGWATHAVCSEVLEHVDDPSLLLRNAAGYLAPGCRLVVTVPGGPMSAFDAHIGHRRHFTPGSLASVVEAAGLEVEVASGAGFPVFNLYRRVVILRGEALVKDVEDEGEKGGTLLARTAMGAFDALFRIAGRSQRRGWQVYAVARKPGGVSAP